MYDEKRNQWEIVDGIFNEIGETKIEKREDNLDFFLKHLLESSVSTETKYWLESLSKFAREEKEYLTSDDESIRQVYKQQLCMPSMAYL